jgi:hypothetical protein
MARFARIARTTKKSRFTGSNLSGVKFEDALKALLKTPLPPDAKKPKN